MTYEQRWGHKRFHKATKHLLIKAQKRKEAEERNAKYQALTLSEKLERALTSPGNSIRQLKHIREKIKSYEAEK